MCATVTVCGKPYLHALSTTMPTPSGMAVHSLSRGQKDECLSAILLKILVGQTHFNLLLLNLWFPYGHRQARPVLAQPALPPHFLIPEQQVFTIAFKIASSGLRVVEVGPERAEARLSLAKPLKRTKGLLLSSYSLIFEIQKQKRLQFEKIKFNLCLHGLLDAYPNGPQVFIYVCNSGTPGGSQCLTHSATTTTRILMWTHDRLAQSNMCGHLDEQLYDLLHIQI
ncbi:KN motif and ankyrin repeat domain-containing protein 4 [Manis javanica]|nr:KN motif and ankyrin repeat domain-containing protein 4 [Manis javanica]